jgi:hypothetical protein
MPNHYIFHVGNGIHFYNSSKKGIWGINSKLTIAKSFTSKSQPGDLLWFVKSRSNGQLIAVATFTALKQRVIGPLITLTETNEELGWTESDGDWDTEVHFKDLYNLTQCKLYTEIKGAAMIRSYNENCKVNLPEEYPRIVLYSKITNIM